MVENPLVSVIIPVHNGERFLSQTLASALAQTFHSLEVVVVDDGSTDQTALLVEAEAARDRRIRLFRTQKSGVAAARNFGISQARGELIAPLDADDLWHPEKILRQVEVMQASPSKLGLVYCWSVEIDENDFIRVPINKLNGYITAQGKVIETLARGCFIEPGSNPLIKRSYVEAVGGYDTNLQPQGADDWKLYLSLAEICDFAVIPEYLIGYRQVTGSVSRNLAAMGQSMENVARWIFEKRPELPEELKSDSIYNIRAFISERAFENSQFGVAFYHRARAFKVYPAKFVERRTFIFLGRLLFRATGLRRAMRGWRRSRPLISFQEFQATRESR
jgi:glycosyltransferase involved in cell wall biosynthesis